MRKRGQVTVFIIVGVVLLLLIGVLIFFTRTVKEQPLRAAVPVAEDIPLEFNPIKLFTEDCLKVVAEQGLHRLGQSGGYIFPERWHGLFFNEQDPTDADGVSFPGSELQVPYWYYNKAPNTANAITIASFRPTIPQMENDLRRWAEQELPRCLNRYDVFVRQGFVIAEQPATAAVSIVPGAVRFALEKQVQAAKGDAQSTLQHFFVELPADLLHLYGIAAQITAAQQNYSFLEQNTLSLLTLFSDTTGEKLPPMTASTFSFASSVFWQEADVKSDVKLLLGNYVPLLRYQDAANRYEYSYPADAKYRETKQRIYDNMILPLSGGQDLEVRFNYLDFWEPYLHTNARGGVIEPQSVSVSLLGYPFGMQRYKTVYDLSYPVWVSLRDPDAMDGQGLLFTFALEANIRDNRPAGEGVLAAPLAAFEESLLCNLNQRTSGNITVVARDAYSREALPDAAVVFAVGDERCTLGVTSGGVLTTPFPVALGGAVHVSHRDYESSFAALDTARGTEETVVADLWRYKELAVAIQKKKLLKGAAAGPLAPPGVSGWAFHGAAEPLAEGEQATLVLRRIEAGEPFTTGVTVTGTEGATLRLLPGRYEVTAHGVLNERVVIPPELRRSAGEEFYVPPPPGLILDQVPNTRLDWNSSAPLEISAGELYPAQQVTFYVLELALQDVPEAGRKLEDFELFGQLGALSQQYQQLLLPEYS